MAASSNQTAVQSMAQQSIPTASNLYFASDTGAFQDDLITREKTQTIAGSLDGDLQSGDRVEFSFTSVPNWIVVLSSGRSFSFGPLSFGGDNKNTIQVRVVSSDGTAGEVRSFNYTIDSVAPTISNVTVPANGAYSAGQTMNFTVQFNENVDITGVGSSLDLYIGGMVKGAAYASKTSNSITYAYTVQAGDIDANGITIGAISLGATTIQDRAGNDAVLSLAGSLPSTAGVLVDTTAPNVASVAVPAQGVYVAGQPLDFVVSFDENVTVTGSDSTLGLTIGSTARSASFLSSAGNTVTYRYAVQAGDLDADGITVGALMLGTSTIRDAASNNASLSLSGVGSTTNVLVDGIPPAISGSISVPADKVYLAGDTLSFTVAFDDNVVITGTSSTLGLTVGGAARSATYDSKTANSVTYAYTVQAGDMDGDGIAINGLSLNGSTIRDGAGNNASLSLAGHLPSTAGILVDAIAPTVTITSSATQLRQGQTATITFTFSEPPASFSSADVTVSGGVLSQVFGSGSVYTATFTPTQNVNSGTASITIAANAVTDAAGNGNLVGVTPSMSFDTLAPSAPFLVLSPASDTGPTGDGLTSTALPTFEGLAESGSIVTLYDSQGAVVASTVAVNGQFSVEPFVALAQGDHTITARAVDSAGNESPSSTSLNLTIDTTAPTVAITSDVSQLKIGESAEITFTFSEAPIGFSAADITILGGTLGPLQQSDADGLVYVAVFTPTPALDDTTASITIAAGSYRDRAGNDGEAGSAPSLTFDTLAPPPPTTPSLAPASDSGQADNITNVMTPTFTGRADRGNLVTLYDTDGVTVLGQVTANSQGDWTITSSTLVEGVHTITALATDLAGNVSAISGGRAVTIDTTAPTVAITSSVDSISLGDTAVLTFTFSEKVSGFTFADLSVTGGVLSGFAATADPKIYTAVFTANGQAGPGVAITGGGYTDVAGNAGAAANLAMTAVQPPQPEPEPQPPLTAPEIRESFAVAAGFAPNSDKALSSNITLADGTVVPNPAFETAMKLAALIASFQSGAISREALIDGVVDLAAPTSGVALSAYQYFTGSTPTKAGMAWLIDSPDNANDLTDPYYVRFNEVNRFINFAVNLGVQGEGRAAFEAKFGALDFASSVRLAYDMVIGLDAASAAGLDVNAALAWIESQKGYFDAFAGSQLGGKAAMIGYIMQAGFEAKVGRYYEASHSFIEDSFDGAPAYQVDLVGGQHLGAL